MSDPPTFPETLIDLSHTVAHGLHNLQRSPRPDHLRLSEPRSVPEALRARNRISDRQDRDGGEYRHLSRLSISPLRRWQSAFRPRPATASELQRYAERGP